MEYYEIVSQISHLEERLEKMQTVWHNMKQYDNLPDCKITSSLVGYQFSVDFDLAKVLVHDQIQKISTELRDLNSIHHRMRQLFRGVSSKAAK
jgi:hypothetical protein